MRTRRGPIDDDGRAGPREGSISERCSGGFEAFLEVCDREGDEDVTRPLGSLARGAGRSPRHLMEERRRSHILRGALEVFGEKGYARTSVQDLIDEAGISRATFYKYFPDREACLVALNDAVLRWLEAEAREEIASAADWPSRVRAVTARVVGLVSDDPRIGRVCSTETMLASAEVGARQRAGLDALAEGLRVGRAHSRWGKELPDSLEDFLVAGGVSLATRSAFRQLPAKMDLGPEIAELMLIPYLGRARAQKLVRGT